MVCADSPSSETTDALLFIMVKVSQTDRHCQAQREDSSAVPAGRSCRKRHPRVTLLRRATAGVLRRKVARSLSGFGSGDLALRMPSLSMCMLFQCAAKMKSSLYFFLYATEIFSSSGVAALWPQFQITPTFSAPHEPICVGMPGLFAFMVKKLMFKP